MSPLEVFRVISIRLRSGSVDSDTGASIRARSAHCCRRGEGRPTLVKLVVIATVYIQRTAQL